MLQAGHQWSDNVRNSLELGANIRQSLLADGGMNKSHNVFNVYKQQPAQTVSYQVLMGNQSLSKHKLQFFHYETERVHLDPISEIFAQSLNLFGFCLLLVITQNNLGKQNMSILCQC